MTLIPPDTSLTAKAGTVPIADENGKIDPDFIDVNSLPEIYKSTQLISGCILSINTDNSKIDISEGTGIHVDNYTDPTDPVSTPIVFEAQTAVVLDNLAEHPVTYFSINKLGELLQDTDLPTAEERRDRIYRGVALHSNHTSVSETNSLVDVPTIDADLCQADLSQILGVVRQGGVVSANGANLNLNISAMDFFRVGVNYDNNPKSPHILPLDAMVKATFRYMWRDGLGDWEFGENTQSIDPDKYDDGTGGATPSGTVETYQY